MRKRNEDGSIKCADCGKLALEHMTLCQKHLEMRRVNNKKKRDRRKFAGLCTECGINKPMDNYKKCQECYNKIEKVRSVRVKKRKDGNCCTVCGRDKSFVKIWTNNRCAGCHLKEKFNWSGDKEEAESIINGLLEKQNYKCALSGRDLKTNKYHIDHIIPRSTNNSLINVPENWQLIVEEANYFKKNKTNQELIDISRDITIEFIKRGIINIDDILFQLQGDIL